MELAFARYQGLAITSYSPPPDPLRPFPPPPTGAALAEKIPPHPGQMAPGQMIWGGDLAFGTLELSNGHNINQPLLLTPHRFYPWPVSLYWPDRQSFTAACQQEEACDLIWQSLTALFPAPPAFTEGMGQDGAEQWERGEESAPQLLLWAVGQHSLRLSKKLHALIRHEGCVAEVMSCAAACRTYTMLLSEGRRLAMAIIP
jgi:Protein of unknown function (DUF498/DUF598)